MDEEDVDGADESEIVSEFVSGSLTAFRTCSISELPIRVFGLIGSVIGCFLTLARADRSCLTFSIGVCFLGWGWFVLDGGFDIAADDVTVFDVTDVVAIDVVGTDGVAEVLVTGALVVGITALSFERSLDGTGVVNGTVLECVILDGAGRVGSVLLPFSLLSFCIVDDFVTICVTAGGAVVTACATSGSFLFCVGGAVTISFSDSSRTEVVSLTLGFVSSFSFCFWIVFSFPFSFSDNFRSFLWSF